MSKNILMGVLAAILVVAVGTAVYNVIGANAAGNLQISGYGNGQGGGNGTGNGNGTGTSVLDIPASDLIADEAATLTYMREEEKLARDVYNAFYATWNLPTFQTIAASEQAHMDEVALLLTRYSLTDPEGAPGVFTNPELQDLYNTLVEQGSQSVSAALKVGGAIEEIDILDLQTCLAQTDNADIQLVFNHLMNGSYNHLNAFSNALLNQTGETYVPQYLTPEMYQSIVDGTAGNGNGGQGNRQGNGYGRGQNGAANGSGVPQVQAQANLAGLSSVHGTVSAYAYGTLTVQTDDGNVLGVQLGNQNYVASLGFAPQVGEGLMVYGFPGDQGLFAAISVTMDNGQVYNFRESTGRPAWAGGNGRGNGNQNP